MNRETFGRCSRSNGQKPRAATKVIKNKISVLRKRATSREAGEKKPRWNTKSQERAQETSLRLFCYWKSFLSINTPSLLSPHPSSAHYVAISLALVWGMFSEGLSVPTGRRFAGRLLRCLFRFSNHLRKEVGNDSRAGLNNVLLCSKESFTFFRGVSSVNMSKKKKDPTQQWGWW